jgi:hypothetical protein
MCRAAIAIFLVATVCGATFTGPHQSLTNQLSAITAQQNVDRTVSALLHDTRSSTARNRGPACAWNWTTWTAGGPTCVSFDRMVLVKVAKDDPKVAPIRALLQTELESLVARLKA